MTDGFDGRVAVVMGASVGIGAATARELAARGTAVVVASRRLEVVQRLAEEIRTDGGRCTAQRADVTSPDDVRRVVETAQREYGRLDYAFNNATDDPPPAPLHEVDVEAFDRCLATSLRGTFLGMRYQVPAMLAGDGGAIVNMASVAGVQGTAGFAPYVAAKAGAIGLTRAAALDYADHGVRVNVVAPGPILTDHLRTAGEQAQHYAALGSPMARVGTETEVARTVAWLCSPDASYVTGVVVPVDGGQSAGHKPARTYTRGEAMAADEG